MTLDDRVRARRLRGIHRAQRLGNGTAACAEAGISRTVFYRWRRQFEQYGADGLHPRRHQAKQGRPPMLPPHTERLIVGVALAWPTWGSGRLAAHLAQQGLATVALSTVQRSLRRAGGLAPQRVLTDGGTEFKGAFAQACRALGIRDTRTRPRHAWTNGFVERFQGTLLQEHWRIQFRRRYFTSRRQLQQSLDAFLRFYNRQRPHSGYRLRGRTPATLIEAPRAG